MLPSKDVRDQYFALKEKEQVESGRWFRTCPSNKKIPDDQFPALNDIFAPLVTKRLRWKFCVGGRASGKSWAAAMAIIWIVSGRTHYWDIPEGGITVLISRITKIALKDSFFQLLKNVIIMFDLSHEFRITNNEIEHLYNKSRVVLKGFSGSPAIIREIKSIENISICIIEEADTIIESVWEVLIPSIRAHGSEVWAIFNPSAIRDYTYQMMSDLEKDPTRCIVMRANYTDNPYCPQVIINEANAMKK